TQRRVFVDRIEDSLMTGFDRSAALDVVAINDYVISILGKRFGKQRPALRIPTRFHLLHTLSHGKLIGTLRVNRLPRKPEHKQRYKYQCLHHLPPCNLWPHRHSPPKATKENKSGQHDAMFRRNHEIHCKLVEFVS